MDLRDYVYEKLTDDGADFQTGQREQIVCPECGKAHISVKPEKGWATCWTPGCEYRVRPSGGYKQSWISAFFDVLHEDWKKYLLSKAGSDFLNVLTEGRKIVPGLLPHLPIGAIPPNYDLSRAIDAARAAMVQDESRAVDESDDQDRMSSQRKKFEKWLADPFDQVKHEPLSLQEFIHNKEGWFARFYVNANGDFVSANLRCSWEKRFTKLQPLPYMGIYYPLAFDRPKPAAFNDCPGDIICFEGEVNAEQFASECIRRFREQHPQVRPIPLSSVVPKFCGLGGVTTWDLETLSRVAESPTICYDNDGGAGLSGVERATSFVSKAGERIDLFAFTTPTKDADEYFKNGAGTLDDFADLWRAAKKPAVSFETVASTIDALRKQDGRDPKDRLPKFDVDRQVSELVWDDLCRRAEIYTSGGLGMIFLHDERRVIEISKDGQDFSNLMIRYGLHPGDSMKQTVGQYLGARAGELGKPTDIHVFSHYDAKNGTVYLSEFNGNVIRIRRDRIDRVANGTDGVLFKIPKDAQPFHLNLEQLPKCSYGLRITPESLLVKYVASQVSWDEEHLTAGQYQLLFIAQMISLFMAGLLRTKPLVLITGESGSAKTMLAERVGWLLLGGKFAAIDLPDKKDDFEALITGTPFAVLDNTRRSRKSEDLQSLVMMCATGGAVSKRELYSTNEHVSFSIQATLYLSTVQCPFHGDEVANRVLIFPVRKLSSYRESSAILREFMRHREEMLGEVVVRIQNILKALEENRNLEILTPFRMADFAAYLVKVARFEGWEEEAVQLLASVAEKQTGFAVENDAVMELFSLWIGGNPNKSVNRWWSAAELDTQLRESYLRGGKLPWAEGDARAMSAYIRNHQDTFAKMFGMVATTDSHLKIKKYRFQPSPETLEHLEREADQRMGSLMQDGAPADRSDWWGI